MTVIKIMLTKKFLAIFLISLFIIQLCSCDTVLSGEVSVPDGANTDVGTVTEVSVPDFESAYDAKKALAQLIDENTRVELYSEAWVDTYRDIVSEINAYIIAPDEDEAVCMERCKELYEKMALHKANATYVRRDTPTVYIYSSDDINRDTYVGATVFVIDSLNGNNNDTVGEMTLRIRGNSTAVSDKKPYNVKFEEKTSILGMPEGRKWCLLANHFDKTLLRNKISYDFAKTLGDMAYLESRFCDLYVNGRFYGNYLITQPVSDGVLDLDIKKGDFLIERLVLAEDGHDLFLKGDAGYVFDAPKKGEVMNFKFNEMIDFMKSVDRAITLKNSKNIQELIDVDSFVSFYLLHEIFKDCDMVTGSTYFYRKDGILYAGPVWDMDLSMGNVSHNYFQDKYHIYNNDSGFGDNSGDSASDIWAQQEWFKYLMQCPFFREKVTEKYKEIKPELELLYQDGGYIDTLCEQYGASFARNYDDTGWKVNVPYSDFEHEAPHRTFEKNVDELKEWLSRRDAYLSEYFNVK